MNKNLIVLLHGVGSQGRDLQGVADYWQRSLQNVIVAAPDAPFNFDMGTGFQWFSVNGITEESRPTRVAAARNAFDDTLNALYQQYDIDPENDRIILAGFSQGAIMALDAIVRGRHSLAGIIAFSGRLASPKPMQPKVDSSVLLIHGKSDQVISWTESQKAAEELTAAGTDVELSIEEGTPHTISIIGMATATTFIKKKVLPGN